VLRICILASVLLALLSFRGNAQGSHFKTIDFKRADSIAALYPKHSLKDLKQLADKLTVGLESDAEKFRAFYRWTCDNIAYDYELFQKNQKNRSRLTNQEDLKAWNDRFSKTIFTTLREKQRTVCTGYAYLLRALCAQANINCVIIDGYGRTANANVGGNGRANHSWNAVQLDGQWYLCDPTWSSGAYDTQQLQYVKKFESAYFLSQPQLFIMNHYPLDSSWMLLNEKPTLNEFLQRPLIYAHAYHDNIANPSPDKFDIEISKGEKVSFAFSGKKRLEKTVLVINGTAREAFQEIDGQYSVSHQFKTKGKYVVHISVGNNPVLTYRVEVR
jgi:hypothetical protein